MSIIIRQLNCRITVKAGGKEPKLHRHEKSERPSMTFAMPPAQAHDAVQPEPSKTVTEPRSADYGRDGGAPRPMDANVDPRAVADRVYEIMKQEMNLMRQRGMTRRSR